MDDHTGSGTSKAAWYADPAGRHQFRYWDGVAWTESVTDDGQQSADPLSQAPPRWIAPRYSGVCESCHAQTSSGQRVVFFAATKGGTRIEGIYKSTSHAFQARSAVFLCERCAKSTGKRATAINRKMADSGLGSTESFDEFEFLSKFAMPVLREVSYVRFRDIMRDDLARDDAADDATLVFVWDGQKLIDQMPLVVRVDDGFDGFGAYTSGWSTQAHVPAGVHKVTVGGLRHCDQILNVAPGGVYQVHISHSRMSGRFALETKRLS